MALGLVLLVCAAAGFVIHELERSGRAQTEQHLLSTAHALSIATDGEIRRGLGILRTLEASEALRRHDWVSFDRQARAGSEGMDARITLLDRSGQQLVNTHLAPGEALPHGPSPSWLWALLEKKEPRVCNLTRGYIEPRIVCIDMPVVEGGRVVYALTLVMRPRLFGTLMARQRVQEGSIAALIDRRGVIIWRSVRAENFIGHPATPDMRAAIARASSGTIESVSLDGVPTLAAFTRSTLSGWTFIVAVSRTSAEAGGWHALSYGLLATLGLLLVAVVTAIALAHRLTGAVTSLVTAANAYLDGRHSDFPSSGLLEIDAVGNALRAALAAHEADEERFRLAQDVGGIGAWDWDVVNDRGHVSEAFKMMHGLAEIVGPLRMRDVLSVIHPDDLQACLARLGQARKTHSASTGEYRVIHSNGSIHWIAAKGRAIMDEAGRHVRALGVVRDVTAERESERALRQLNEELEARVEARTAALRQTQDALRQAQKLESMGQLTGGVAHDFNNLLTPIVGSLDMLQRRRVGTEREQRLIEAALQSADKAKTLVQRLLAFARRQPLQAVAVDLAGLIDGMAGLIASTSGPRIRVDIDCQPKLPAVKADPNQIEMAILNLSLNARDAMPDGGRLSISAVAELVQPTSQLGLDAGHYVRLSISDTGTGMDEATRARAIEPFFSTKGIGKGTGLGLSMVHGLASQLGGTLTIESRPALGTTVSLWLPMAVDAPVERGELIRSVEATASGTILLVDDDDLARASTAEMLSELGYAVAEAASGDEAVRLAEAGVAFDLLVTDHLMPGMTGEDLARRMAAMRPATVVLIISGYAEIDGLAADLHRLAKPFRQADLAAKLREITASRGPIANIF